MRIGKNTQPTKNQPIIIPPQILTNEKITSAGKILLGIIAIPNSNWTLSSLAELLKITRQSIHALVEKLIKLKLLKWTFLDENSSKKVVSLTLHCQSNFTLFEKSVYSIINYEVINNASLENNKDKRLFPKETTVKLSSNPKTIGQRIKEKIAAKKTPKPEAVPNPFLEKISAMPNLPRHRVGTAIYQNTVRQLDQLKKGKLYESVPFEDKWLKQFDIPNRFLNQPWPEYQLIKIFENVSKTYTLGHEPADKKTLPSTLLDILYNPRSRKSLFLKIAAAGRVRLISSSREKKEELKLTVQEQQIVKRLISTVQECFKPKREIAHQEHASLISTTKGLICEYDNHIRFLDAWDTPLGFVKDYIDWVKEEYSNRLDDARQITLGSICWKKYIKERGIERSERY